MSKRKQTPSLPGLPSSERERIAQAKLAGKFSFLGPSGGERLSIQRAEAFAARCKDIAASVRRTRREARARTAEAIENAAVRRRFLAEQREMDRAIERFWRRFFTKVRQPLVRRTKGASKIRSAPIGYARLPKYSGPIIDRLGHRGVYMDVRYYGARRARLGVGRRLVVYITREDGVEHDGAGDAIVFSNIGADPAEQAMAFDLVETLNRAAQGNAKIVFSMIVNLPHDVSAEARREILARFCGEAFGLHDLPYVAAVHEPSAEGDQRNKHGHVVFALRPLRRAGDHEWEAGRELLTEFDKPERFAFYRELFAQVMTEVVQEQGKRRIYTHLSNADRGLKNKPLIPLGPAKTAIVRRGGVVAENERNRAEVARSEKLVREDRALRRHDRAQARIDELRALKAAMLDHRPAPIAPVGEVEAARPRPTAVVPEPAAEIMHRPYTFAKTAKPTHCQPPAVAAPLRGATSVAPLEPAVAGALASVDRVPPMAPDLPKGMPSRLPTALANSQETRFERVPVSPEVAGPVTVAPARAARAVEPPVRSLGRSAVADVVREPLEASRLRLVAQQPALSAVRAPLSPAERPISARSAELVKADPPLSRTVLKTAAHSPAVAVRRLPAAPLETRAPIVCEPVAEARAPQRDIVVRPRAPRTTPAQPIVAKAVEQLLELHRRVGERAAARRQAKERQRRRPGIPPWMIGGGGIGD